MNMKSWIISFFKIWIRSSHICWSICFLFGIGVLLKLKAEAGERKMKITDVKREKGKWSDIAETSIRKFNSACSAFVLISRYCTASTGDRSNIIVALAPGRPPRLPLNAGLCPCGWRCDVWRHHRCVAPLLPHWIPERDQADESQRGAGIPSGIDSLRVLRVNRKTDGRAAKQVSLRLALGDATLGHGKM